MLQEKKSLKKGTPALKKLIVTTKSAISNHILMAGMVSLVNVTVWSIILQFGVMWCCKDGSELLAGEMGERMGSDL